MRTKHQKAASTVVVHVPMKFTVRGGRKTIIGAIRQTSHTPPRTRFDDSVAKALARAWRWKKELEDGVYATAGELAKAKKINESYVTRILRLNVLAPDIVDAVLDKRTSLTVQALSVPLPAVWQNQRSILQIG